MTRDSDDIYTLMAAEIRGVLQRYRIPAEQSGVIAAAITGSLRRRLCRNTVYFPVRDQAAYDAIRADFDGSNHDEVIKKHGISRATLYRILK